MPVDYESLAEARLDHGLRRHDRHGRHVLHGRRRQVLHGVLHDESCGKCVPCRVGTAQMHGLLDRIAEGQATAGRPGAAGGARATWSSSTSLCGLGQGAPNPVFSTLRYFRDEYVAHIVADGGPVGADGAAAQPDRCQRALGRVRAAARRRDRMPRQDAHDRRPRRRRPARTRRSSTSRARTASSSRRCATSTGSPTSAPAGCAWSRSQGVRKLLPGLRHRASRRGWRSRPTPSALARVPADDRGAAVRRAQPRLLGLRRQRPLRAAGRWPSSSASTTSRFRYLYPRLRGRRLATSASSIDHNRCILCTRCVRVCDEIEGAHTWDVMGRGIDARVITDLAPAVGRVGDLHQLRQVRAGLPHRRPVREGHARSPRWRKHRRPFLPYLRRCTAGGPTAMTQSPRLATVWLDGCSGCHMSFLDLDERLIELAEQVDLVYSPLVDVKEFPDEVDVTLVEGAVASEEDLEKIRRVRADARIAGLVRRLRRHRQRPGDAQPARPGAAAPAARLPRERRRSTPRSRSTGRAAAAARRCGRSTRSSPVDVFLPGCPPSADLHLRAVLDRPARRPDARTCRPRARFGR